MIIHTINISENELQKFMFEFFAKCIEDSYNCRTDWLDPKDIQESIKDDYRKFCQDWFTKKHKEQNEKEL